MYSFSFIGPSARSFERNKPNFLPMEILYCRSAFAAAYDEIMGWYVIDCEVPLCLAMPAMRWMNLGLWRCYIRGMSVDFNESRYFFLQNCFQLLDAGLANGWFYYWELLDLSQRQVHLELNSVIEYSGRLFQRSYGCFDLAVLPEEICGSERLLFVRPRYATGAFKSSYWKCWKSRQNLALLLLEGRLLLMQTEVLSRKGSS